MEAVMYGAGNIGRGFIGEVLYKSGYNTTFIDVNDDVVNNLNKENKYPIYLTGSTGYYKEWVRNVDAINGRDKDAVVNKIADTDLLCTALGVNILKFVAELIAEAIELRIKKSGKPLNIMICENMIGSNVYLHDLVDKYISAENKDFFEKNIGFVCVSVGRVVPPTPEQFLSEPLAVCADPYYEIPVDAKGFRPVGGKLPKINGLVPFTPFDFFIERKLLLHNMAHAMMAYIGRIKGYDYIYEIACDPEIKYYITRAMIESGRALARRHGAPCDDVMQFIEDLMPRLENDLLIDSVERVGKDTIRKLGPTDRLVGAFKMVKEQGGVPAHIAIGIAAGLLFDVPDDSAAVEISSCAKNEGIEVALEKYSGIVDKDDVAMIENFYNMLSEGASFEQFCKVLTRYKKTH